MKKRKGIVLLTAACLILSGCSGSGTKTSDAEEAIVDFSCVANPGADQEIYVILKSYHGNYWEKVIEGVHAAAKETDKAVYLGGIDNETDIEGQRYLMKKAVERGADAILLAPVDSTYLVENCIYARGKGIPVTLIDSVINTSDYDTCFMTDNLEAGKMAAREMLNLLKEAQHAESETLKVGIQLSSDTSQAMVNRVSGFLEYWSDYAPKKWGIVEDIPINGGNIDTARKNTEILLEENTDIKGLFGCNNTSTIGIANTIFEKNRTDIVVVGFDLAQETKKLIESKDFSAVSIMQNQDQMGYKGLLSLDALLQGEKTEQKYYDTGVTVIDSSYFTWKDVS